MTHEGSFEVKKHVRTYLLVFFSLAILTVVTVGVSYLSLTIIAAIAVALTIAVLKGSLVASFFMHLAGEKKIIFWVLVVTVVFFAALLLLPVLTDLDMMKAADVP